MTTPVGLSLPLSRRLWIYQAERFPVTRHGLLIAVFAAAGVSLSAHLAHRPLPGGGAYLVAGIIAFLLFFQLRVSDEVKDAADDLKYRPERPVPRGLISLNLLVSLGLSGVAVQAFVAGLYDPGLLLVLVVVWAWMTLMAVEFLVPAWLRGRPTVYLASHMLVMPLIDLFVTACEWLPRGGTVPPGLWAFLVLSFANGCVLEIGRKTWSPENERTGVESYSKLWGCRRAALVWIGCLLAALAMTSIVGWSAGALLPVALGAGVVAIAGVAAGLAMRAAPTGAAQRRLETMSGFWVLASYVSTGFVPVILSGRLA